MPALVMLTGVTRVERKLATLHVIDAVNRLGGWIDDIRLYSNLMSTIRLTLPAGAFGPLVAALATEGIAIDPLPDPGIAPGPAGATSADPRAEQSATLQLTFLHDEPDLRREVPAVPG
ncbi:MAG: hypothetical protein QE284_20000 [Rhizobium sp.]|nr:hypothetical protein [Rhizobium sp.]